MTSAFVVITGSIAPSDFPELCGRVRRLLEGDGVDQIVCDVGALDKPDAVVVDALARLQLTARRCGGQIRLRHPCGELQELLTLMGLDAVVRCGDDATEA